MINQVKITNLHDAERYSFSGDHDYDIWISAVDSCERRKVARMRKNFDFKNIKFCSQFFADWSEEDGIKWDHLKDDAPTEKHISKFISFLKPLAEDNKVHNLGVNCFAGISRSSALAIIALVMSGKTPQMALEYVLAIRPIAWPNLRILRLGSEILNVDMVSVVKNWKENILGEGEIISSYEDLRQLNTQVLKCES
jgi:predicted protein tyrosine phosphatase